MQSCRYGLIGPVVLNKRTAAKESHGGARANPGSGTVQERRASPAQGSKNMPEVGLPVPVRSAQAAFVTTMCPSNLHRSRDTDHPGQQTRRVETDRGRIGRDRGSLSSGTVLVLVTQVASPSGVRSSVSRIEFRLLSVFRGQRVPESGEEPIIVGIPCGSLAGRGTGRRALARS